jgi:acetyl/propionyl-CoA carboxylase alpha subunit
VGLDEDLRQRLFAAALTAARAVGYTSCGTVEFLLAPDRSFYFLEMNTRLQVEHPVTEEVWGVDLAAAMIRIALGGRSHFRRKTWPRAPGIAVHGGSAAGLPSPGRIRPSTAAERRAQRRRRRNGLDRADDCDPMLGKLIVHAGIVPGRRPARAGPGQYEIAGVGRRCPSSVRSSGIASSAGGFDVQWLDRQLADGLARPATSEEVCLAAAALTAQDPAVLDPANIVGWLPLADDGAARALRTMRRLRRDGLGEG